MNINVLLKNTIIESSIAIAHMRVWQIDCAIEFQEDREFMSEAIYGELSESLYAFDAGFKTE